MLLLIGAVQYWFLVSFGPRHPTGDEQDYLARGYFADPYRPTVFLRVPLYLTLARWITIRFEQPQRAWRRTNAAIALAAAAVMLMAANVVGGATALWTCGAFLLVLSERTVLATHIWPDTLLSLLNAMLLLLLLLPVSPLQCALIGLALAMAVLTRIEQLVLLPGVLGALALELGRMSDPLLAVVTAPAVLAILTWSWAAHRRYGTWWPDTTWMFNLRLLEEECAAAGRELVSIEPVVHGFYGSWVQMSPEERKLRLFEWMKAPPSRLLSLLTARVLAFWGPDTFVSDRLLPPAGAAYGALDEGSVHWLKVSLRWSFPLVSLTCLWAILAAPVYDYYLLPGVLLLGASVLVHFRTRFRLMLIPWLIVAGADGIARIATAGAQPWLWLLLAGLYAAAYWLVRKPPRPEHA